MGTKKKKSEINARAAEKAVAVLFTECPVCSHIPDAAEADLESGQVLPPMVQHLQVLESSRAATNSCVSHVVCCSHCNTHYLIRHRMKLDVIGILDNTLLLRRIGPGEALAHLHGKERQTLAGQYPELVASLVPLLHHADNALSCYAAEALFFEYFTTRDYTATRGLLAHPLLPVRSSAVRALLRLVRNRSAEKTPFSMAALQPLQASVISIIVSGETACQCPAAEIVRLTAFRMDWSAARPGLLKMCVQREARTRETAAGAAVALFVAQQDWPALQALLEKRDQHCAEGAAASLATAAYQNADIAPIVPWLLNQLVRRVRGVFRSGSQLSDNVRWSIQHALEYFVRQRQSNAALVCQELDKLDLTRTADNLERLVKVANYFNS